MKKLILAFVLISFVVYAGDDEKTSAKEQYDTAIKNCKDKDGSNLVKAIKQLIKAVDALEKAGDEKTATEGNSQLFWLKKKLTINDVDELNKDEKEKEESVDTKVAKK